MAKEEDVGKLVKIHSDLMAKFQDLTSRGLALVKEIGILKQVVSYLAEFKVHWTRLTVFFKELAELIKVDFYDRVLDLITTYLNVVSDDPLKSGTIFLKSLDIAEAVFQLEEVTKLYVNVSDVYLSKCILRMNKFTVNEEACRLASRDILQYAGEKKIELLNQMQMGRSEFEKYKFLHDQLLERSSSKYVTQNKSSYFND